MAARRQRLNIAVIHVNPVDDLAGLSPIRKCLLMLFLHAIQDRASKVSSEYGPELSRLKYEIDGEWRALDPFPEAMGPLIGQELRSWINPSRSHRALADWLRGWAARYDPHDESILHYPFLLIVDPMWSIWDVTIQSQNGRGRVEFGLLDYTEWGWQQVGGIFDKLGSNETDFSDKELAKFYPGLFR
jgi:hypothetical protein